jgi:hypothetical protein
MSETGVLVDTLCANARRVSNGAQVRRPRKIRYTDAEWSEIVDRARVCGRPPARYVRETSLGSMPKTRPTQANASLIRELGRIGIALQRLAATAREARSLPQAATLDAALAEVIAVVRQLS